MPRATDDVRRSIRVRLPDRPGSLSELTRLLAENGANVVRFEVASYEGDSVWDDFEIETSSSAALASVVRAARAAGYEVVGLPRQWGIRDWSLEVVTTMADIAEMDDTRRIHDRLLEAVRTIARTDHSLILSDEPHGDAAIAEQRWEALELVSHSIDSDTIVWSGEPPAIEMARLALRSNPGPPPKPSRSRLGGAALLLGGTSRRGVLVAVGGRPPFLPAETERLRRFVNVVTPWIGARNGAVAG